MADCNEKTATIEISNTQVGMPTAATSCKVLCTYICACTGGLCRVCRRFVLRVLEVVLEVLKTCAVEVLEVSEVMRCALLCVLEAVEVL